MEKLKIFNKSLIFIFFFIFFGVLYLVYEEPGESIFLIFSFSALIIIIKDRERILLEKKILIIIFYFILSYIISIFFIFSRGYKMDLSIMGAAKETNGKAVLIVYEGESEKYSFTKSIANIQLNNSIVDKVISPFSLWQNKRHYQRLGKSEYAKNAIEVKKDLQLLLSEEFKVYVSYIYDSTYAEEALIDIVNDGYQDVIIVPIFLSDGENLSILKSRIEKMKLFKLNINVKYTEPLWNSEVVIDSYTNMFIKNKNDNIIESTGVILVGEGQKGYKRNEYLQAVKEDSMFRNRLKSQLVSTLNFNEHKIKMSWFSYVDPNYKDDLKSLLEYGVAKIIIIYTKPSVTNIENITISQGIVSKVEIPDGVSITIIDGFLKDLGFINELKNMIEFVNFQRWD